MRKINLDREIKTLRGDSCVMSFPGTADVKRVQKELGVEEVTLDLLPKETVGNMLVNALANYEVANRKEVFEVNQLGAVFMKGGEVEIPENLVSFLAEKVMPQVTKRIEEVPNPDGSKTKEARGLYHAWSVVQVYDELGVTD